MYIQFIGTPVLLEMILKNSYTFKLQFLNQWTTEEYAANIYLFQVNNGNTRIMLEIY